MKIYRIQNKENDGAYNCFDFKRRGPGEHPNPDILINNINEAGLTPYSFYYGFKNLKQLKRWFYKKDRFGLHNAGYFVAIYEVPKKYCFYDQYQAAFFLKKAKQINTIILTSIK